MFWNYRKVVSVFFYVYYLCAFIEKIHLFYTSDTEKRAKSIQDIGVNSL